MNTPRDFQELLEHYVFDVAAKYTGLVDKKAQSDLMDFVSRVSQPANTNQVVSSYVTGEIDNAPSCSLLNDLKSQWDAQLQMPGSQKQVYSAERRARIHRLIVLNQHEIEHITLCIDRIDVLMARAEKNSVNTFTTRPVNHHYQRLRTGYALRLVQLETYRQEKLGLLRS